MRKRNLSQGFIALVYLGAAAFITGYALYQAVGFIVNL